MIARSGVDSARLFALRSAALDSTYVSLGGRRTVSVHEFYRYPARFSPQFANAAIQAFTDPNDLVIDPFVGGGTSLVEAQRLGRCSIGADINPLATFVATAKTDLYSQSSLDKLREVAVETLEIPLAAGERLRSEWAADGYWRNISDGETWRIRNLILKRTGCPHVELALDDWTRSLLLFCRERNVAGKSSGVWPSPESATVRQGSPEPLFGPWPVAVSVS